MAAHQNGGWVLEGGGFTIGGKQTVGIIDFSDPFDNIFLALASENSASLIISGDRHLLEFESYKGIQIVTPSEGVSVISSYVKS